MSAQTDIEQAAADAKSSAAILKEFVQGNATTQVANGLVGGIPSLAKLVDEAQTDVANAILGLPVYVDTAVEYANLAAFPTTGAAGVVYVAVSPSRLVYRWSGTGYAQINPSPGSTDSVPEGIANLYFTTLRAAAAAPVQSVAGRTGAVVLTSGDITTALNYTPTNTANKDASGGHAGLTGFLLNLKNTLGTTTNFFRSTSTAPRTWDMPDKSGTVALLDDITTSAGVTAVSGTAPIVSTGGPTPAISLQDGGVTTAKMANAPVKNYLRGPASGTGPPAYVAAATVKADLTLTAADVGLANVDNVSDANKPISTAVSSALSGKASATHTHSESDVAGLTTALSGKAPIASPTFTGTVSGITAAMVGLPNVPNTDATVANNVILVDAGNYYPTNTAEAALQTVGAYLAANPITPTPTPTLSAPAAAAGAEGSFATFNVTFSAALAESATATVTLSHITTAAADITSIEVNLNEIWTVITSGATVTVPAGAVDLPVRIWLATDAAIEGDETFTVAVAGVTGLSGTTTTTVTVVDNGVSATPVLAFVGAKLESIGDLVITLPALATGDVVAVVISTANQTPDTPSGWTSGGVGIGAGTAGAAGARKVNVFWAKATATNTPSSVTFVDPGDHMLGVVLKFTGADATTPYAFSTHYQVADVTNVWLGYGPANIPPNSLVVHAVAHGISTTAPQFSTYINGPSLSSLTEAFEGGTTLGVGGGLGISTGAFPAGGVPNASSVNVLTSTSVSVMVFAIAPTQPIGPPPATGTGQQITDATISGMQAPNDGVQLGYQRSIYACVHMGLVAKGTNTPTFWNGPTQYKDADPWTGISPWWNLLPLQGNAANNVSLEIGTIMLLTRATGTNNYTVLYKGLSGWAARYDPPATFYISTINGTPGTVPGYSSVVYPIIPQPSADTMHGGGGLQTIDATKIDNLIVVFMARITGPDVALSNHAMWTGADWYPFVGYNVQANAPYYVPGICSSRMKKVTGEWQIFATAPLDIPGRSTQANNYTYGTVGVYTSSAQLKANPVPNIDGLLPP